jgi:hypothetical protein
MKFLDHHFKRVLVIGLILFAASLPSRAQAQGDAISVILDGMNAARIANNLTPYALNSLLTLAAQRHSEYQRDIGHFTHDSADGGRTLQRVQAVGYPAIRANENVYAGIGGPQEAVNWWLGSTAGHVQNILHPVMREVGIGAATAADGVAYYTVDFSAQPNQVPIFVNSNTYSTDSPQVTLSLHNEGVFPGGPGQLGYASQIMVSNSPDFAGAVIQPWAQFVPWTLDTSTGDGEKTVYVRFIDFAGRTADSQDSIILASGGAIPAPAPTEIPIPTSQPQPVILTPVIIQPTPQPLSTSSQIQAAPIPATDQPAATQIAQIPESVPTSQPASPSAQSRGLTVSTMRLILTVALGAGMLAILVGSGGILWARLRSPSFPQEADDGTEN